MNFYYHPVCLYILEPLAMAVHEMPQSRFENIARSIDSNENSITSPFVQKILPKQQNWKVSNQQSIISFRYWPIVVCTCVHETMSSASMDVGCWCWRASTAITAVPLSSSIVRVFDIEKDFSTMYNGFFFNVYDSSTPATNLTRSRLPNARPLKQKWTIKCATWVPINLSAFIAYNHVAAVTRFWKGAAANGGKNWKIIWKIKMFWKEKYLRI